MPPFMVNMSRHERSCYEQPSRHAGFTLIELITTLVILGILTAISAPRFFNNTAFDERGYADEVAAALRYASSVAVASNCNVAVTLTTTDYQADQAPTVATCKTVGNFSMAVQRADGISSTNSTLQGTAPANVTLSPATQIIFDSQGAVISGATLLQVSAPTLTSYTLTVDAVSGLVTVQ